MLASYLDSTNLKPDSKREEIISLCQKAAELEMAAVCINPVRVPLARQVLQGSQVGLATVIAFPLGATPAMVKKQEALRALKDGANELDVVINGGAVKDRDYDVVTQEIKLLLQLKEEFDYTLKIIVETALLTVEELKQLTVLVGDAGADYIKTSTGFGSRGVRLEDIKIINGVKKPELKVKASGGIKTLDFARQLIQAGVSRIGSSNAEELLQAYRSEKQ
ncbi:MAG: deoxyribose-phosphate aldolase [Syntrophomonadaceae bacterium]|nr:deoxyribose-phosphate aldolase [Syntrophomonadaceae bacterium]